MQKILIVEDDMDFGDLLSQYLALHQFEVERVHNGVEARLKLIDNQYDILLLDVMMPKEDGFTLAKNLQQNFPHLPFLFITARKMKEDVLKGLQLGADDYITKPFDVDELILRIKNILKRTQNQLISVVAHYTIGLFTFDVQNLLLISPKSQKQLTEKEAKLLLYLLQHKNQLIKRNDILNYLWEEADFFSGRSMDVFMSRLRKYLAEDSNLHIESIRGVGFRFSAS